MLRNARATLQKASAAISGENYDDATKWLTEVREKLEPVIVEVQKIPPASKGGRRRGR